MEVRGFALNQTCSRNTRPWTVISVKCTSKQVLNFERFPTVLLMPVSQNVVVVVPIDVFRDVSLNSTEIS